MRNGNSKHECPLLKREIFWGDCCEVQEIREDNMDMELFSESFDLKEAERVCEKCRWCYVNDEE